MPSFSATSKARLETCDPRIQRVLNLVVLYYDCTILCGFRNEREQTAAFNSGHSKVHWPEGKHNTAPSKAVDAAPWMGGGVPWECARQFYHFAGYVLGVAKMLGISLRWGGDWDRDNNVAEKQSFDDLCHFEIVED